MANKILKWFEKAHQPINKKLIKYGWELRLVNRKRKMKFKKLTQEQKKEIKAYWKQFGIRINTDWVAYFYTMSGIYDKKYLPESLYYSEIQPVLNNFKVGNVLSDKNLSENIFTAKMPKTIIRKINNSFFTDNYDEIDLETAIKLIQNEYTVIIKPANESYGGDGIEFWDRTKEVSVLREILIQSDDLIIQEILEQHDELAKFHRNSLNTIRIVTLKIESNTIVLNAILRMGVNNSKVDNYSAGGIIANLDENGNLFSENIQSNGKSISQHPNSQIYFEGESVIHYDEIVKEAINQHNRVPYFKLVSWDFAIDIEGDPVLIEGNYPSGQLDLHQLNKGSLFGEYTDPVLKKIYNS